MWQSVFFCHIYSELPSDISPYTYIIFAWWWYDYRKKKKKKKELLWLKKTWLYIFLFDTLFTFCTCCSVYVGVLTNNYLVFMYLDIDECKGTPYPCIYSNITCLNSPGNFSCLCTKGYDGDGRRNGTGCFHKVDRGNHSALRLSIALGKFPYIGIIIFNTKFCWL